MLPDDLLAFLRTSIRSVWALELLLLLCRQSGQGFTADELVRALRATPKLVDTCLEQLRTAGLVASNDAGGWRYTPASPLLSDLVEQLERAYGERPVAVISAIVGSPDDRLRNFADAFRFPKKGD